MPPPLLQPCPFAGAVGRRARPVGGHAGPQSQGGKGWEGDPGVSQQLEEK